MKTAILFTSLILLSFSACCPGDDSFQIFEITVQFFDNAGNENLFDADGPLTREDISFNWDNGFGEEMEMESVVFDTTDGSFTIDLFTSHLNRDNNNDVNIFFDRATGERDTLKLFAASNSGICGTTFTLNRAEFNGSSRSVVNGQQIDLRLP